MNYSQIPLDGFQGLKQNWRSDALSGFLVFLLALPLSLGIAKASEFPPAMGVLTAMIGGLLVTLFAGSRLTIKGPAAGLITICAGAVTEMGGGQEGWQLALGAVVVAAGIQILFGFLKFGTFSEIFPHSAVHGMLAAIGLIIFSKQIHVLLGIDPATLKGLEPIALFERIPDSIRHADPRVTVLGVISLVIIFGLPFVKNTFIKRIPAPMYVLGFTIPMAWLMDFKHTEPAFDMVKIGDFWGQIGLNVRFDLIESFVFWKYVVMFLFVNTIETLLTVKAIDGLDPWKRPSDPNKDLVAVGIGNSVSSVLGGLPMISEVARSSANVNFGGRTRWANFFHGLFLLVAMLLFIPVIEMIPNTALAALLIAVGYRLASPNEFFKVYKIGSEQLAIFIITILVTLATDLLVGVGAGIIAKLVFHLINGVPLSSMFKGHFEVEDSGDVYKLKINQAAVFTNILSFKKAFNNIPANRQVVLDFTGATMLDHTFMELLHHFEDDYEHKGGNLTMIGFERFKASSSHPLAARKFSPEQLRKIEINLDTRQVELRDFAGDHGFTFYPQRVRDLKKFKDFPITTGNRLLFEENIMTAHRDWGRIEISDIGLTEGVRQEQREGVVTVLELTELDVQVPDFSLEPESLWSKFSELTFGKDVDFGDQPGFSKKYYLRGQDELAVRKFFNSELRDFLENREEVHLECHRNRILLYKRREALAISELRYLEKFAEDLVAILST
ncbi:MAG: SulP family inorganic anion transporter [Bacteroidetes bacterium]|nr:SulP family inorganic anion transporter [Bacteroidota bacterium]